MPSATVALVRCSDYSEPKIAEAIRRQFELLGGVERFVKRGDRVLLKPNFIAPKSRRHATQTDPAVIIETAKLLKDYGARPFVGDSPAWGNVFTSVRKLKMEEPLRSLSVPIRQLNKPKKCLVGTDGIKVGVSSAALDADVIINLPKFKTHQQVVATFAVKNMFGCVSGKRKALWHFSKGDSTEEFCRFLIEIFRFLKPALTIIDAVVAMDGPGPIKGRARPLGWLIGGTEPIACETVCCKLVNIRPQELPMIKAARQMEYGCSDVKQIEIAGERFGENVCTDFQLVEPVPIRFSLLRICKSVSKQILLLAKGVKKG